MTTPRKIGLLSIRKVQFGQLEVLFTDRELQWRLPITASQLRTFDAFRVYVADRLSRWVARKYPRKLWDAEVAAAMEHGHRFAEARRA